MFRKLAPCFYAIIIDALGFGLVYPVMTALFTAHVSPVLPSGADNGIRHFYLGLSYLLYPLCMFFGAAFMGDLSDILGRKKVLILCMSGITVSFLMMGAGVEFGSLVLLLLGRASSGLMAGSQPIAQAAVVDVSTEQTKAINMSLISLSYSFGAVFGPLIGGILSDPSLVQWFDLSIPFFVSGGFAALAVIFLLQFKETFQIKADKRLSVTRPITVFAEMFHHPKVRSIALLFILMQIGFSLYFQFVIVHMHYSFRYSNWQLGLFQTMLGLGFALGILIGMPFAAKRFRIETIAVVTCLLTGAGQVLAALIPFEYLQWLIAVFVATVDIMAFSSFLTLFSNAVDKSLQGWVMGISGSAMAVAWVISGFGSNLLTLFPSEYLILIGGICLMLSAFILKHSFNLYGSNSPKLAS